MARAGATVAEHFCPHTPVRPTDRVRKQVPGFPVRCFSKRICVDADRPVTNQTGFIGRRPWKLFRLSERTFGWTSTTPRRTCRRNCFLCTLYCVLCTECCACIVYSALCTARRVHMECATVLWLVRGGHHPPHHSLHVKT